MVYLASVRQPKTKTKMANLLKQRANLLTFFRHVDRTHNIVPCEHCGKIFTKRQYERHYKSTHMPEKDKTYLCAICVPLKGFNYRNKFEEHMNVHNGEKPFKCKMCNAAYASSGNLCAHIRTTHKGIKRVKKWALSIFYSTLDGKVYFALTKIIKLQDYMYRRRRHSATPRPLFCYSKIFACLSTQK